MASNKAGSVMEEGYRFTYTAQQIDQLLRNVETVMDVDIDAIVSSVESLGNTMQQHVTQFESTKSEINTTVSTALAAVNTARADLQTATTALNSASAQMQAASTAMAAKQDKITGTKGQIVGFNDSGNLAAQESWHSNPNLLDNWYFVDPINQRGETEYTSGYTIDRWVSDGYGKVSVEQQGVSIRMTHENAWFSLSQIVEKTRINTGDTYTFSVLGKGNFGIMFKVGTGYYSAATHNSSTIGMAVSTFNLSENIFADVTTFDVVISCQDTVQDNTILAVKLELGPVQTLAHKDASGNWVLNDPPPNYQQELAKCQRYQQVLKSDGGWFLPAIGIMYPIPTQCRMMIPLCVPLRCINSIVMGGQLALMSGTESTETNNWPKVTVITQDNLSANTLSVSITVDRDLEAGKPYFLWGIDGNVENKIILDANL